MKKWWVVFIVLFIVPICSGFSVSSPVENMTYAQNEVYFEVSDCDAGTIRLVSELDDVLLCEDCSDSKTLQMFGYGGQSVKLVCGDDYLSVNFFIASKKITPYVWIAESPGFFYDRQVNIALDVYNEDGVVITPEFASLKISRRNSQETVSMNLVLQRYSQNYVLDKEGFYDFEISFKVDGVNHVTSKAFAYFTKPELLVYSVSSLLNQDSAMDVVRTIVFVHNFGASTDNVIVHQELPKDTQLIRSSPQGEFGGGIEWVLPSLKKAETKSLSFDLQLEHRESLVVRGAEARTDSSSYVGNDARVYLPVFNDDVAKVYLTVNGGGIFGDYVTYSTVAFLDLELGVDMLIAGAETYAGVSRGTYIYDSVVSYKFGDSARFEVLEPFSVVVEDSGGYSSIGFELEKDSYPVEVFVPGLNLDRDVGVKTQQLNISFTLLLIITCMVLVTVFVVLAKVREKNVQN